mgnify:CR=1 FL=1|jgi:hypothetical protein
MTCDYCRDSEGKCVFPYNGMSPHDHDDNGNTVFIPRDEWPDNYSPDMDINSDDEIIFVGTGMYQYCPKCGDEGYQ